MAIQRPDRLCLDAVVEIPPLMTSLAVKVDKQVKYWKIREKRGTFRQDPVAFSLFNFKRPTVQSLSQNHSLLLAEEPFPLAFHWLITAKRPGSPPNQ